MKYVIQYGKIIISLVGLLLLSSIETVIGLPVLTIVMGVRLTAEGELIENMVVLGLLVWMVASMMSLPWIGTTGIIIIGYIWFYFGKATVPSNLFRLLVLAVWVAGISSMILFNQLKLWMAIYLLATMGVIVVLVKGKKLFQLRKGRLRW